MYGLFLHCLFLNHITFDGNLLMIRKSEIENLVKVKQNLAAKYERLARSRHSKPRRDRFFRQAEDFRRQAINLAR